MTRDEPQHRVAARQRGRARRPRSSRSRQGTRLRLFKGLVERCRRGSSPATSVAFNHAVARRAPGPGGRRSPGSSRRRSSSLPGSTGCGPSSTRRSRACAADQRRELARWRSDHALVERMLHELRAGCVPLEVATALSEEPAGRGRPRCQRRPVRGVRGPAPRQRRARAHPPRRVRARPAQGRVARPGARRRDRTGRVPRGPGRGRDRRVRRRHQRDRGRAVAREGSRGRARRRASTTSPTSRHRRWRR